MSEKDSIVLISAFTFIFTLILILFSFLYIKTERLKAENVYLNDRIKELIMENVNQENEISTLMRNVDIDVKGNKKRK